MTMKFTLSWLKEHLETDKSLAEITDAMTMAGLEIEGVEDPGEALAAFTVAHVKSAEPHPDADKLRVCTVDTFEGEKLIVRAAGDIHSRCRFRARQEAAQDPRRGIPRHVVFRQGAQCRGRP